jgi:hypothetical protein
LSVFFFIVFSFALRRLASANNSDVVTPVCVSYEQNTAVTRCSDSDEAVLRHRMIWIGISYGQGVTKDRGRFLE